MPPPVVRKFTRPTPAQIIRPEEPKPFRYLSSGERVYLPCVIGSARDPMYPDRVAVHLPGNEVLFVPERLLRTRDAVIQGDC